MSLVPAVIALLLVSGVATLLSSVDTAALGEPEVSIVSPADGSIYRSLAIVVIGAAWNTTRVQARLTGGDWVNATFINGTGAGTRGLHLSPVILRMGSSQSKPVGGTVPLGPPRCSVLFNWTSS